MNVHLFCIIIVVWILNSCERKYFFSLIYFQLSLRTFFFFLHNLLQLYRRGDRSPVSTFPNDEHRNYWKEGFGQLTEVPYCIV